MILRIVRMEFEPGQVDAFLEVFRNSMEQIRHFPGCHRLELHRDPSLPNIMYTVSEWDNEASLEAYRMSPLFNATWARTKVLFAGKPMAFSLESLIQVKGIGDSSPKA